MHLQRWPCAVHLKSGRSPSSTHPCFVTSTPQRHSSGLCRGSARVGSKSFSRLGRRCQPRHLFSCSVSSSSHWLTPATSCTLWQTVRVCANLPLLFPCLSFATAARTDLGRDNIGIFNGGKTLTPNIDRLYTVGSTVDSWQTSCAQHRLAGPPIRTASASTSSTPSRSAAPAARPP